jgi:DNA-binding MarR family transcriptional regulator
MPGLPTLDELRAWREFSEAAEMLRGVLAARLSRESGLSPGDYAVLHALTEQPSGRMSSAELARRIGGERSRLSRHLGRMERRGLITRDECAADVVLEAYGAEVFLAASLPHLRAVRELFVDALTPAQLAAAGEVAAALRRHLHTPV